MRKFFNIGHKGASIRHKGASLVEYAVLVGLIAVVAIYTISSLGRQASGVFQDAAEAVTIADPADPIGVRPGPFHETPSGTTLPTGVPGDVKPGEMMIGFFTHRSALTLPAGWTHVVTDETPRFGTTRQWLSIYTKRYEPSDGAFVEAMQAESNRMLSHIIALEGDAQITSYTTEKGSPGDARTSDYFTRKSDTLILAARSAAFANGSRPVTVTVPAPWTMSTTTTMPNNRQSVAYRQEPKGDIIRKGVTFRDDVASTPWVSVLLRVERPDPKAPSTDDLFIPTGDPRDELAADDPFREIGTIKFVREGGNVTPVICSPFEWSYDVDQRRYEVSGVVGSHHDQQEDPHSEAQGDKDGAHRGFLEVPNLIDMDIWGTFTGNKLITTGSYAFTTHIPAQRLRAPDSRCEWEGGYEIGGGEIADKGAGGGAANDAPSNGGTPIDIAASGDWNWDGKTGTSSNAGHSSSTTLHLDMDLEAGDRLAFAYEVSSEPNWDTLSITTPEGRLLTASGSASRTYAYRPNYTGSHRLTFTYSKDSSSSQGQDRAVVRDIVFTPKDSVPSIPNVAITGDWSYDGETAESTNVSGGTTSSMVMTVSANAGDVIALDYAVSSEPNQDLLIIELPDGGEVRESGEIVDTYHYTAPTSGDHVFTWRYRKDGSVDRGEDRATMRRVRITSTP
mgnify:CR=1 FL=1